MATWLLRHFGSSPNNDSIIGDLNERYRQGHSRMWYWRQTTAGIGATFCEQVWSHKLLTVRAMAIGWAVAILSRHGFNLTWEALSALRSWSRFWRHEWITVAVQVPEVVLAGVLAGWLVAKLHHRHQKAMVLACAAYIAALHVVWLLQALNPMIPFQSVPLYSIIYTISNIAITVACILIGGGIFSRPGICDSSERNCATV